MSREQPCAENSLGINQTRTSMKPTPSPPPRLRSPPSETPYFHLPLLLSGLGTLPHGRAPSPLHGDSRAPSPAACGLLPAGRPGGAQFVGLQINLCCLGFVCLLWGRGVGSKLKSEPPGIQPPALPAGSMDRELTFRPSHLPTPASPSPDPPPHLAAAALVPPCISPWGDESTPGAQARECGQKVP